MSKQHVLKQLKYINRALEIYADELREIYEMNTTIASPRFDSVVVSTGTTSDPTSETAINISEKQMQLLEELQGKRLQLIEVKEKCIKAINMMSMPNANILFYYYYRNYTFEQTAAVMDISFQWAWELHRRALKEFDSIYSKLDLEEGESE